jgi:hypothetical protein
MSESTAIPTTDDFAPPTGGASVIPAQRLRSRSWALKACAWSGPIFLIGLSLTYAALAGYVNPPREHWGAEKVASYYQENDTRIMLGMMGMILFACFYYFWSLAIARLIQRTEGRESFLARIQVFGAQGTVFITTAIGVGFVTAAFRAGERDPESIRLVSDVSWMIFMLTPTFVFFQLVAIGVAWLRADESRAVVPRWLGYLTLWVCATFLITYVAPFVERGPLAWHGLIVYYIPFGLFCNWMAVACFFVLRAVKNDPSLADAEIDRTA